MAAPAVFQALQRAGLSVSLTPERGLLVRPASALTPELRELVRQYRGALLSWLEPVAEPSDWHALAGAYHDHHFHCAQCIAAGRGTRYGLRCDVGEALWCEYAVRPP
jgi:hypothetical protein